MPKTTVTNYVGETEIDVKRFQMPATIESECPRCGAVNRQDLMTEYLSYPRVGTPFSHEMYCRNEDCEHEWSVSLLLTVRLEVA